MKRLLRTFVPLFLLGLHAGRAANSTAPIDVTQRNAEFGPEATITPPKRPPQIDHAVQDRRFEKNVLPKPAAGDMPRAAIEVAEPGPKALRAAPSGSLAPLPPNVSPETQRAASLPANVKQPRLVTRYQDGLAAARAASLARYPEMKPGATSAKLNRFVFRKNVPEPALVTPAAGSAAGSGGAK
ncbi:MAG: hypothetical protein RIQ93_887 [Verrucomicrobiota bacterium]|jgi:hypothetical protein